MFMFVCVLQYLCNRVVSNLLYFIISKADGCISVSIFVSIWSFISFVSI